MSVRNKEYHDASGQSQNEAMACIWAADKIDNSHLWSRVTNIRQRQPQLQLALGIVDHVRRRFGHFKLGAHFLDLRGLLVQTRRHSVHSSLLLRDGRFLVCHCGL